MPFSFSETAIALQLSPHDAELSGALAIPTDWRRAWHPATHALWEWTNYTLHCPDADGLRVGARRVLPIAPGVFWLRFENRLGLVEIQALREGRLLGRSLWLEVLSPKFPTLEAHRIFWNGLIEELFVRLESLPFAFEAATKHRVQPSQSTLVVPSALWAWHFFLACGPELQRALAAIEAQPQRALREHWERVPLWENYGFDAEVCLDIVRSPADWRRAATHARDYPIVQRLNGRLPQTVASRQAYETLDTPLNRWLCGTLKSWLQAAQSLENQSWWARVAVEKQQRIGAVEMAMQRSIRSLGFAEEAATKVLLPGVMPALTRRIGYAQVWKLWQRFQQTPQPFWQHCQDAIDVRDVATLYEVWSFFALSQSIGDALNSAPLWELRTSDVAGLQSRSAAHFGNGRSLVYNRRTRGYSSVLRPDFAWIDGDKLIVFDAKFRLDRPLVAPDQSTLEAANATHDDLWTMHAYRDALSAQAAVAIYPGRSSVFYHADGRTMDECDNGALLQQILQGRRHGIGALAMRPSPLSI